MAGRARSEHQPRGCMRLCGRPDGHVGRNALMWAFGRAAGATAKVPMPTDGGSDYVVDLANASP